MRKVSTRQSMCRNRVISPARIPYVESSSKIA
jgi:hypothetical protein